MSDLKRVKKKVGGRGERGIKERRGRKGK